MIHFLQKILSQSSKLHNNITIVCKTAMYRDFKQWKCMGENIVHKDRRKTELKADFYRLFRCKIYENNGHFGSSINGKQASLAFSKPALLSQITGIPLSLIQVDHFEKVRFCLQKKTQIFIQSSATVM